jgi:transposase
MGEEHTQPSQRIRRGFSKEFKRDAVELVRSTGRPIAAVARELGIYDSTLATGCARTASTVARPRG